MLSWKEAGTRGHPPLHHAPLPFVDGLHGGRTAGRRAFRPRKQYAPLMWGMTDGVWRILSGTRKQAPISTSKNTSALHVASSGLARPPAVSRLLGQQLGHSAVRHISRLIEL